MIELAAAALLVLYGNALNARLRSPLPGSHPANLALGLGLSAAGLLVARAARLTPADLGLRRWRAGSALGVAGAVALALPAVAALSAPMPFGGSVAYAPARAVSGRTLARHLAISLPLAVALPEELLFRGALLAALRRRVGVPRAIAATSVAFALWHVTSLAATLRETQFGPAARSPAIAAAGAAAVLLVGGLAFGALRETSGSIAAPLLAHWGFNAAVLLRLRA